VPFLSHLDNNKLTALVVFGAISMAVAGLDFLMRSTDEHRRRAVLVWYGTAAVWIVLIVVEGSSTCAIKHKPPISFKRRGEGGGFCRGRNKKSVRLIGLDTIGVATLVI
jgi:hypothetical protein